MKSNALALLHNDQMQKKSYRQTEKERRNKTGTNVRRLLDYFTFEDTEQVFCLFFSQCL